MATTLLQEIDRANDPTFRALCLSAARRTLPDIIGEATGVVAHAPVSLTQAMVDKRHAWAMDFLRQPDFWVPRIAGMLAGETQIRNQEPITVQPTDAIMNARFQAIVNDLAGVKSGE